MWLLVCKACSLPFVVSTPVNSSPQTYFGLRIPCPLCHHERIYEPNEFLAADVQFETSHHKPVNRTLAPPADHKPNGKHAPLRTSPLDFEVEIGNYRSTHHDQPVTIRCDGDLTGFVGVNNSGKSSLMKFFFDFRRLFEQLSFSNRGNEQDQMLSILAGQSRPLEWPSQVLASQIFNTTNELPIEFTVRVTTPAGRNRQLTTARIKVERPQMQWSAIFQDAGGDRFQVRSGERLSFHDGLISRPEGGEQVAEWGELLDVFRCLAQMVYIPAPSHISPNRPAQQSGANGEQFYDLRVGEPFIAYWDSMKHGNRLQRAKALSVEVNLAHIFGVQGLQIQAASSRDLQVAINKRSFALHELGLGLGETMLVLGNLAFSDPSYVFIDEPELNLHPSLQLDFLTSVTSYAKEGCFFATHSLGLARQAANRLYAVSIDHGRSAVAEYAPNSNLAELAGELSFGAFKQIGCDAILLVEGKTELKTVQQLLRLYDRDHSIVLLPLAGEDLANESEEHLAQITRITPHVYALIDSEKSSGGDALPDGRRRFVDSCGKLGINCTVLGRRALENYFSQSAIKKIKPKGKSLQPFEKLDPSMWNKRENWRIARQLRRADLRGTDLESFMTRLPPLRVQHS